HFGGPVVPVAQRTVAHDNRREVLRVKRESQALTQIISTAARPTRSLQMLKRLWQFAAIVCVLGGGLSLVGGGGVGAAPINAQTVAAVSVQITPASMTVTTGTVEQFTAIVNGAGLQNVQWRVNGIDGGAPIIGTIDSSGNYTAPQFIPNPPTVTLTAVADA